MPHPFSDDLRSALAPLIRKKGVRATARSVGVHHAMLVDWMASRRDIPSDVMVRLVARLGLTVRITRADQLAPPKQAPHSSGRRS